MLVNRAECADCGAHVDYLSRDKELRCECGAKLAFVGKAGVVYSSGNDIRPEVHEYVEDLRTRAVTTDNPGTSTAYDHVADELENLLEEHGGMIIKDE